MKSNRNISLPVRKRFLLVGARKALPVPEVSRLPFILLLDLDPGPIEKVCAVQFVLVLLTPAHSNLI